jgi:hypothetical protein
LIIDILTVVVQKSLVSPQKPKALQQAFNGQAALPLLSGPHWRLGLTLATYKVRPPGIVDRKIPRTVWEELYQEIHTYYIRLGEGCSLLRDIITNLDQT